MNEETIKKETLDYLDRLCLGLEMIEPIKSLEYIKMIDRMVEQRKEELREAYSLKLKR